MAWKWSNVVRSFALLACGLTLGLLLSAGLQAPSGLASPTDPAERGAQSTAGAESARVRSSLGRLESEQQVLKNALAELRRQLASRQQSAAADAEQLTALQSEVQRQRFLAGLTPVEGPGVIITLDDSQVQARPNDHSNRYLVHDYNLRDVANLLWMAGSEAIAINDERLVGSSSIYCVGSTVLVNNTRLSPPYIIRAIGNPRLQQDYLRNPSYLQDLRDMQRLYGLQLEVRGSGHMALPAYSGGLFIEHARPGD